MSFSQHDHHSAFCECCYALFVPSFYFPPLPIAFTHHSHSHSRAALSACVLCLAPLYPAAAPHPPLLPPLLSPPPETAVACVVWLCPSMSAFACVRVWFLNVCGPRDFSKIVEREEALLPPLLCID